jgi:ATP-binding cassette subfamily B protein
MDCGPSCLRMVAKHYGKNYSLDKLRDLCHITKEGVSLLGISEAAEAIGFKTYLNLSGYAYMVYGTLDQVRMKRLAHATMTNAWTTTKSDWLKMKREWNEKIEEAGKKYNIPNPKFASRDGCWQGSNGFSNVLLLGLFSRASS